MPYILRDLCSLWVGGVYISGQWIRHWRKALAEQDLGLGTCYLKPNQVQMYDKRVNTKGMTFDIDKLV
jgi:hypothetical protein